MTKRKPYKYKEEFCEELIEWMAEGKSYMTWGAMRTPTISKTQQYKWEQDHPEWKEAKEIGYAKGLAFFETLLRSCALGVVPPQLKNMGAKNLNLTAIIFTLKTRFHEEYSERQKIEHTNIESDHIENMNRDEKLEMADVYKKMLTGEGDE